MDHQHFEKKLLNDEQMTPEEKRALQSHLQGCDICAALADINLRLRNVGMVAPAPGFATRFSSRLAAQRKTQKRRHFFGGLILLLSGAGLLLWFVSPMLMATLSSPTTVLSAWVSFVVSALSLLQVFSEVSRVVLRVATGFIPTTTITFAVSAFSLLGMFLISSTQKFKRQAQTIKL